jgi:hypothetical protein
VLRADLHPVVEGGGREVARTPTLPGSKLLVVREYLKEGGKEGGRGEGGREGGRSGRDLVAVSWTQENCGGEEGIGGGREGGREGGPQQDLGVEQGGNHVLWLRLNPPFFFEFFSLRLKIGGR